MKLASLFFATLLALFAPTLHANEPKAGVDYIIYAPPQPVDAGPGKIEVIEFFAYTCPHCADIDPLINNWLKTVPKDVSFRRIPIIFRPQFVPGAKIYYTLDTMDLVEKLHPAVFTALHKTGINLMDEKTLFEWVGGRGVDAAEFANVYRSFSVQSRVQRADQIGKAYNVPGTPALVVNGKYLVSADIPHAQQLMVVDYLIAKERAAPKKK